VSASRWRAAGAFACGAALAVVVHASRSRAADQQMTEPQPPPDEITVDARTLSYDKQTDVVTAVGDVVIRRGESVLRGDQVQLDRRNNQAYVVGDSVLTNPDAEIHAASMSIDLDDETGDLTDARIYSERLGYTISGDRIEKRPGQSYRIENGEFTTCNCGDGPPQWSIAGKSLDIAVDGYGTLSKGQFKILDWPVLWFPGIAFPVSRDRQSGLLVPRVGFSNRRGFQLLQPYYWAISKSQDATVRLDVETSLRIGLLTEYRYAFSRTTSGAFEVGYFNEAIRQGQPNVRVPPGVQPQAFPATPENRWGIIGDHLQQLGDVQAYADVLLVGDNLFLREMNTFTSNERRALRLRTYPFTTTRAGFLEEWERALLRLEGVYYQDLIGPVVNGNPQEQEPSLTIQRAPELDLLAQKQLGWGLMGLLDSSVTDFQRGTGITGFRGDLAPSGELRLPLGRSVFGALHATFRETAYGLTQSEMQNGFAGVEPSQGLIELPSTSSREIFEVRGDIGTSMARVYDFPHFGLDKLKHTIEPLAEYRYVPPVDQEDLPVFDGIDRINKRSLFTYGFASRLLGRTAAADDGDRGDVLELARFSATQSYDFLRDIAPTRRLDPISGQPINPGVGDHFSDIDFALRVNPTQVTSVRGYATYDTSENVLSSATIGIRLREPQRIFGQDIRPRLLTRATFNVEYRYITDTILQLIDSSMALPITNRIAALYALRYDLNVGTFLSNYVGVRLLSTCDCWSLNLGFTQTRNPNEVQVQAQFRLAGFGDMTKGSLATY
jgi:LPS-assembly protein